MYTSPSWTGVALLLLGPAVAAASAGVVSPDIDAVMFFGDSYTATGWRPSLGMSPSVGQKILTTTGGLSWAQYVGIALDAEQRSFNFASIGATVDSSLVNSGTIPSLVDQVDSFQEYFSSSESEVTWASNTTLFSLFYGVNDIGLSYYYRHDFPPLMRKIFVSYSAEVGRLYAMGARRFLILSVPPTDRTPLLQDHGPLLTSQFRKNIHLWNTAIEAYVEELPLIYPGAHVVFFDTHALFTAIFQTPASYGIEPSMTSTYCYQYSGVVSNPFLSLPECGFPLSKYLWLNEYHASWTIHKYIAEGVETAITTTSRHEIQDGRHLPPKPSDGRHRPPTAPESLAKAPKKKPPKAAPKRPQGPKRPSLIDKPHSPKPRPGDAAHRLSKPHRVPPTPPLASDHTLGRAARKWLGWSI